MKKFATIAGSVALFAATLIPAFAAGNNCGNATTGPFSNNSCTINNTSRVTVNNVNDAQIVNKVTAVSNSGNNSASKNTLGGSVVTGNATLNAMVSSVANVNTTTIDGGAAAGNNTGTNNVTGPDSNNFVTINNKQRVRVNNDNTASIYNKVDAEANTGNNTADENTGPAMIRTGNSWLGLSVLNHANDSATGISAGAGGSGGNTGYNSTTGPYSNDVVTINNTAKATVNNVNDAQIGNYIRALSQTGRNSASKNTLGGAIDTGNATGNVTVDSGANINTTTVQMAFGGFTNTQGNGVTGPYSNDFSTVNNNQKIVVDNWNNKCRSHNADRLGSYYDWEGNWHDKNECDVKDLGVFNYDLDVANTGNNTADENTGGGALSSGWTNLYKTIQTRLNDTLTVIK